MPFRPEIKACQDRSVFIGFGTAVNVCTVLAGAGIGLGLGQRLPDHTQATVTNGIGLFTMLVGGLSAANVTSSAMTQAVGPNAGMLTLLGALLLGGIAGSLLNLEARLDGLGSWLQTRIAPGRESSQRFIQAFVTATLVFCAGPLTILGSLSDGLGEGADQLLLKSVMDFFTSIAFAASLGIGVLVSVIAVAIIQGVLTVLGYLLGGFLTQAEIDGITSAGGLVLVGIGIRLLDIKAVSVSNLLPALVFAPLLVALATALH